jgi:mannan endo-1,4-beta-mannosidase
MHDDKWNDLITEGTALYNRWVEMMDDIAQYLEWLKAEAVEVLFRPLHEMNQGW